MKKNLMNQMASKSRRILILSSILSVVVTGEHLKASTSIDEGSTNCDSKRSDTIDASETTPTKSKSSRKKSIGDRARGGIQERDF